MSKKKLEEIEAKANLVKNLMDAAKILNPDDPAKEVETLLKVKLEIDNLPLSVKKQKAYKPSKNK